LRVDKVRLGHRDVLLIVSRQLQSIQDDVEVTTGEPWNELVPLILDHLCFDTKFRGQRLCQVVFKTDQLLRFLRIRIDVRSATFGIGTPQEHTAGPDDFQGVGAENREAPARKQEYKNQPSYAQPTPGVTHQSRTISRRKRISEIFFSLKPSLGVRLNFRSKFTWP
jgi:hypothetical protein